MQEFSVKALTKIAGVNPHTLRAWERRYGAISPKRSSAGRRIYSLEDVERLRMLVGLVDNGHAISQIANLSNHDLKQLVDATAGVADNHKPYASPPRPPSPLAIECLDRMLFWLEQFDLEKLAGELSRARAQFGARVFALEVIVPLMSKVAEHVIDDRFSLAQERALSALVRSQLGDMIYSLKSLNFDDEPADMAVAFTTQEGDNNEFGILLSALLCSASNVKTFYLGPNLPPEATAEAASALQVDVVMVGCSPTPPGTLPRTTAENVALLHNFLERGIAIWIGGLCDFDLREISQARQVEHIRSVRHLDSVLSGQRHLLESVRN